MKVPLPQLRRHQVRTHFFDLTSNIYGFFWATAPVLWLTISIHCCFLHSNSSITNWPLLFKDSLSLWIIKKQYCILQIFSKSIQIYWADQVFTTSTWSVLSACLSATDAVISHMCTVVLRIIYYKYIYTIKANTLCAIKDLRCVGGNSSGRELKFFLQ